MCNTYVVIKLINLLCDQECNLLIFLRKEEDIHSLFCQPVAFLLGYCKDKQTQIMTLPSPTFCGTLCLNDMCVLHPGMANISKSDYQQFTTHLIFILHQSKGAPQDTGQFL